MKYYFILQLKIINRKIIYFGLPLIVAYIVIPLLFFLICDKLISVNQYGRYFLPLTALGICYKLNNTSRNEFIKSLFNNKYWQLIRLTENLICSLPFCFVLLYRNFIFETIITVILTSLLSLAFTSRKITTVTPTPFHQKPFEFIIGFRKNYLLLLFIYSITAIAISSNNKNLGVFALLTLLYLVQSFYSKLEDEYFIWIYASKPSLFLNDKIETALKHFTILALPILIPLCVYFYESIEIIILGAIFCYAFLIAIVLVKYNAYPNKTHLPNLFTLFFSIFFPPLLLIVIPYFRKISIDKLSKILK